jgi:hypothetical protein
VQPNSFYFGGGAGDTVMHPLVALAMIVAIILMLRLRRKYAIIPFFACAFLIPPGQMLVLGGVHLFVLRIVILFACARMLVAKLSASTGVVGPRLDSVDKVFMLWAVLRALAFLFVFSFQSAAVVNQVAFLLDVFGGYFLLRFLVRDTADIQLAVRVFAIIAFIVGLCMLNEKLRNQNIFGYLGGFPIVPQLRDGAIRAQGSFEHPILAGSFGATLLPLFFWLWKQGKLRLLAIVGVIGSTCMVLSSASSTPLMAYVGGIVAVCLWPMRRHMRAFRWGIVILLIGLHLVMKAPVWFLIARVDLTGASSGYHRAMLVDTFIRHFSEWWLIGTNTNASWGYDMWDLSNQFVAEGVTGGLATFICFIALISMSFGKIGVARKAATGDRKREWFLWCLGAALVSHIVAFWGISYFDHTQISWFALLVMISVATAARSAQAARQPQVVFADAHISLPQAQVRDAIETERMSPF